MQPLDPDAPILLIPKLKTSINALMSSSTVMSLPDRLINPQLASVFTAGQEDRLYSPPLEPLTWRSWKLVVSLMNSGFLPGTGCCGVEVKSCWQRAAAAAATAGGAGSAAKNSWARKLKAFAWHARPEVMKSTRLRLKTERIWRSRSIFWGVIWGLSSAFFYSQVL